MRITEVQNREEKIRQKFGDILFGNFQYSVGLQKNKEKDTRYESEIFKQISNWFFQAGSRKDMFKALKELSQLKDMYPTILKPDPISKYPKLYRAIRIKWNSIKLKQLAQEYEGREDIEYVGVVNGYKVFKFNEPHEYKPKASVESWTTTFKNAINFVKEWNMQEYDREDFNDPKLNRMFIYEAAVPEEERLFKLRFTNKMFDYKESEVVRLSGKPIPAIIYLAMKGARPVSRTIRDVKLG